MLNKHLTHKICEKKFDRVKGALQTDNLLESVIASLSKN